MNVSKGGTDRVRDGALIVLDKEAKGLPHAADHASERRLWEATDELLAA